MNTHEIADAVRNRDSVQARWGFDRIGFGRGINALFFGPSGTGKTMAASILAKVARDRNLLELHAQYPEYGFDSHFGYPTPQHFAALERHGATPHHRRSFAPVRMALERERLQGVPQDTPPF